MNSLYQPQPVSFVGIWVAIPFNNLQNVKKSDGKIHYANVSNLESNLMRNTFAKLLRNNSYSKDILNKSFIIYIIKFRLFRNW